ncbi:cytochrome C [Rhodospirillum rubrum]|uniref:c-type cytochrome n=1 Tax=Rhodospirillum rubrum TaxID=1085 RepID=UPI00190689EB|nr:cytochrome c [Rhodospirillum rubrum]MBK1665982.1 cytochrome C [Rhodospirillum rubrum]MBK1677949.1 cytochrome C [Rhodospirillum rubrum]
MAFSLHFPPTLGLAFFLAASAGLAWAAGADVIQARRDGMKTMKSEVRILSQMIEGQGLVDPQTAVRSARSLGDAARAIPGLFPEGSARPPSTARLAVWADWAQFTDLARQLSDAADDLERAAASGSFEDADDAFVRVTRSCRNCHRAFKED